MSKKYYHIPNQHKKVSGFAAALETQQHEIMLAKDIAKQAQRKGYKTNKNSNQVCIQKALPQKKS